jgi:hypothetical protein
VTSTLKPCLVSSNRCGFSTYRETTGNEKDESKRPIPKQRKEISDLFNDDEKIRTTRVSPKNRFTPNGRLKGVLVFETLTS